MWSSWRSRGTSPWILGVWFGRGGGWGGVLGGGEGLKGGVFDGRKRRFVKKGEGVFGLEWWFLHRVGLFLFASVEIILGIVLASSGG